VALKIIVFSNLKLPEARGKSTSLNYIKKMDGVLFATLGRLGHLDNEAVLKVVKIN